MQENEIIGVPVSSDNRPILTKEIRASARYQEGIDFIRDVIIIVVSVLIVRTYLVAPFQISGESMEASYHDREFILVNKFSYADFWAFRIGDPVRGDVVILRPHAANGKEFYIKRVVGMPGDTIKFEGGEVFIRTSTKTDFVQLDEKYLSALNKGKTFITDSSVKEKEFTVPAGEYFVMGDNRNYSADSRSCFQFCSIENSSHFVSRANVIGKVFVDFGYQNVFHRADPLVPKSWPVRLLDTPKDWTYGELNN